MDRETNEDGPGKGPGTLDLKKWDRQDGMYSSLPGLL